MKKISFFLIGMTSVLLAFAMIGCDNGTTTKTEYVNTGGGGGSGPGGPYVTNEDELRIALTTPTGNPIYVVGEVTLTKPLVVPEGQSIVVTQEANTDNGTVVQSAGGLGPLFALVHGNGKLNIAYNLTLRNKASLTVDAGAAVAVKTPVNPTELLTVQEGATVNVKTPSGLTIEPKAEAHFETGAILAVVNVPSVVVVETSNDNSAYGLLTIDEGLKVVVQKTATGDAVALYAGVTAGEDTIQPIIEIPTNVAAAKISDDVTVYSATTAEEVAEVVDEIVVAVNTGTPVTTTPDDTATSDVKDQVVEAVKDNPEKTTSDGTKVNGLFNPTAGDDGSTPIAATEVTYTGTTALGTVSVPANAKLIITGAVVAGTTTPEPDTTNKITLASGAALEIATGASIDFGTDGTLTGATGSTVTNNGTIKTAVTGEGSGATLNALIAKAGGKIEASGEVTVAAETELTVPSGATLTVAAEKTLTIEDDAELYIAAGAEVIVEGTLVNANGSGGDLIGTITIETTGALQDLSPVGGSLWGESGTGKYVIKAGGKMYRGGSANTNLVLGGTENGSLLYLQNGSLTMTQTAYVLDGDLTSYGFYLGTVNATVFQLYDDLTITVKAGKTLKVTDISPSGSSTAFWVHKDAKILGETGAKVVISSTNASYDIFIGYAAPSNTYGENKAEQPNVTPASAPTNFNFYNTAGTDKAVYIYTGSNDYEDSEWGPFDIYGVAEGTYNWDATAGGAGKAGWKKE